MFLNAVGAGKGLSMIKRNETLALVAGIIIRHRSGRVNFSGRPIYRHKLLGAEISRAHELNLADKESQQNR